VLAYCVPGGPTVLKTSRKLILSDGLHSRPTPTIATDADMLRHYATHKNRTGNVPSHSKVIGTQEGVWDGKDCYYF
jgi:hypothetical protein